MKQAWGINYKLGRTMLRYEDQYVYNKSTSIILIAKLDSSEIILKNSFISYVAD